MGRLRSLFFSFGAGIELGEGEGEDNEGVVTFGVLSTLEIGVCGAFPIETDGEGVDLEVVGDLEGVERCVREETGVAVDDCEEDVPGYLGVF